MKNELAIQNKKPELLQVIESGTRFKDIPLGSPVFNTAVEQIIRILGLVERDEEELQRRHEIALEGLITLKITNKSLRIEEVILAFRYASANQLPLKNKIRTFDSNSIGDVITAYKQFKRERLKVYRKKEQDLQALELASKLTLKAPSLEIPEIAEKVKAEYLESGMISIWFSKYWGKIWFYFYEMPKEEAVPFMEKFRKKALIHIKQNRSGNFLKHVEISEREIKIKMAELSLIELWKL